MPGTFSSCKYKFMASTQTLKYHDDAASDFIVFQNLWNISTYIILLADPQGNH